MTESIIHPVETSGAGQTTGSWLLVCSVIVPSVLSLAFLYLGGNATLLRVAFPAAALLVGLVLYVTYPIWYAVFALWLWFITPMLRRLIDWHFGYVEPNFVLLAPLLVSGLGGLTLLRQNQKQTTQNLPAPFVLCSGAILYAVVIDLIQHPSQETVYGLANWLCPLAFGLHFYLTSERYEQHRAAITKTFLIAVPLLGLYGIYQFIAPAGWDTFWLINISITDISPSFGQPEPFLIRVWSTMNAPGPFANTMMAGLLLLITARSPLKLPGAVAGYLSLLLSVVRAAWLSWMIGFLLILKNVNPRAIIRIFLSLMLLIACVLPLASDPAIGNVVWDRVNTFTELHRDGSLQERTQMYRVLLADALDTPYGFGFKNRGDLHGFAGDSGILVALLSLGWLGSALFALGILSLFFGFGSVDATDQFAISAKGIVVALFAQIIAGNIFVGVTGALFWMFAGLRLAAHKDQVRQLVPAGVDMMPIAGQA
jgi:hypothetical protein